MFWTTADRNDVEGPEPLDQQGLRAAKEIAPGLFYRWIPLEEPIRSNEELRLFVRVRHTVKDKTGGSVANTSELEYRFLEASD
ncbi:MAG: hypothetical protein JKY65_15145 [Planctomycetes bacterium]|nr:hypothetical protein [Planctomycetota bacterium]